MDSTELNLTTVSHYERRLFFSIVKKIEGCKYAMVNYSFLKKKLYLRMEMC